MDNLLFPKKLVAFTDCGVVQAQCAEPPESCAYVGLRHARLMRVRLTLGRCPPAQIVAHARVLRIQ